MADSDRITLILACYQDRVKVRATQVAVNMAIHRPVPAHLSRSHWDVTQISSGKRVGRFTERPLAVNYAHVLLERLPSLADSEELSKVEHQIAADTRAECGGVP